MGLARGGTGLVGPAQHLPPPMSNPAGSSAGEPAWAQPSWGPGWLGSWPGGGIYGRAGPGALSRFLLTGANPCPRLLLGSWEADGMVPWLVLEGVRTRSHWPHLHRSWPRGSSAGVVSPSAEQAGAGPQKRGDKSMSISLSPCLLLQPSAAPSQGCPRVSHTLRVAKDAHREVLDVRWPLCCQLEKLHIVPLHPIYGD